MTDLDKRQEECVRELLEDYCGCRSIDEDGRQFTDKYCDNCPKHLTRCNGFSQDDEALTEWLRKAELQKAGKLTFGDLAVGEVFVLGDGDWILKKDKNGNAERFQGGPVKYYGYEIIRSTVRRITAAHVLEWMEG